MVGKRATLITLTPNCALTIAKPMAGYPILNIIIKMECEINLKTLFNVKLYFYVYQIIYSVRFYSDVKFNRKVLYIPFRIL